MTVDFGNGFLDRNISPRPNNTGDPIMCKEDTWQDRLFPGKQKYFQQYDIKSIISGKFRGLSLQTATCISLVCHQEYRDGNYLLREQTKPDA
jgi:hypothetical protein